jgi:hypothetical protein
MIASVVRLRNGSIDAIDAQQKSKIGFNPW